MTLAVARRPPPRDGGREVVARSDDPGQDGLPGRRHPRHHDAVGQDRHLPLLARSGTQAVRPLRPHPGPAKRHGLEHYVEDQRAWFADFWAGADVEVGGPGPEQRAVQQAVRFSLFSLAQATGRVSTAWGCLRRGVTGSGYEGHFATSGTPRSTSIPFLTYTSPRVALERLHFRSVMLPAARERPARWRRRARCSRGARSTARRASAYYAAGSAQVHIDADIAYALMKYVRATRDHGFLVRGASTSSSRPRAWADLGFWRSNGDPTFHIHGVTGPDEYDGRQQQLFTNVMAVQPRAGGRAVSTSATTTRRSVRVPARLHLDPEEVEEGGSARTA